MNPAAAFSSQTHWYLLKPWLNRDTRYNYRRAFLYAKSPYFEVKPFLLDNAGVDCAGGEL
jgi:hypothetical protein